MPAFTENAPEGTVSVLSIVLLILAIAGFALTFLAYQATTAT